MLGKSGKWLIPPVYGHIVLVTITIIFLCLAAGCMNSSGNTGNTKSGGGGNPSFGPDDPETSTWQATVSGTENVRTVSEYSDKYDPKSSRKEETTSSLQFHGSFPVLVEHEKESPGEDIYKSKFVENDAGYPVSGSYSEHSSSVAHGGYAGCHPMPSYTFDYTEQGTIEKTNFDFTFYPDNRMVQLDGSFISNIHSKSVSSDGECDNEESTKEPGVFWFQCNSADKDENGQFRDGTRDFDMNGKQYVITCHSSIVTELKDNDQVHYTSPSSTTRDITMKVVLDPVPPEPKKLKANPGGPYTVQRGTSLQLDGSRSTGSITEYRWTFSPGSGCPSGLSLNSAELTESQPSATFLCPVTAKLTVTDGKKSDSASVQVNVVSRDWQTPFSMSGEGIDTSPMATPPWINSPSYAGYEGGANICGLCKGTADENTNLHPPAKDGSWEPSGGYELTQVTEPGKPFDKYWFVSKYNMQMNRMIVINPYILPPGSGGKEIPYGMGTFYQKNVESGYDVDGYLAGVRQHEQDHSNRMKAALEASDPVKKIEPLFDTDKDSIKNKADSTLREVEKKICTRSSDASQPPMSVTWTGKMVFPTSDTNQWKEGMTDVGGYRKDAGESCG